MKVEIDQTDLRKVKSMLFGIKENVKPVQARSINKTLTGVKTDSSTAIREDLNLPKRYVDKHITVIRASSQNPGGRVDVKSKPVGLINFTGTRQLKKGVSVKIKKSGARSAIEHAFIANAKGAENVFRRAKPPKRTSFDPSKRYGKFLPRHYRFPIERLTGPRLTDNLSKPEVIRALEQKAGVRLLANVEHEVSRELEKYRA